MSAPLVLVTGSRTWKNELAAMDALIWAASKHPGCVLLHGACPTGADEICARLWKSAGLPDDPHPADWKTWGSTAGFERNAEMVALRPVVFLAFAMPCEEEKCRRPEPHPTHGTEHCAGLASKYGVPGWWIQP